jgi:hypothetical protein
VVGRHLVTHLLLLVAVLLLVLLLLEAHQRHHGRSDVQPIQLWRQQLQQRQQLRRRGRPHQC